LQKRSFKKTIPSQAELGKGGGFMWYNPIILLIFDLIFIIYVYVLCYKKTVQSMVRTLKIGGRYYYV